MTNTTSDSFVQNTINNFKNCLGKYATFSGRASRSEYWLYTLVQLIVLGIALTLDIVTGLGVLYPLVSIALLLPSLAVSVRRLHDAGHSGWWLLLIFTFIGSFLILYFVVKPTEEANNKYGEPAKPVC